MSKLVKNTTLYTIGNIFPQAANFLLLPVYSNYLNPTDFGIISSMQVISAILNILFTLALERSIYRLYFDYYSEKDKRMFLGTIFVSITIASIIIVINLFLFNQYIVLIYKSISFFPYYAYTILTVFVSIYSLIPKIYYQVTEQSFKYVTFSFLQFILNTVFILVFLVIYNGGAEGMLKGQFLGSLLLMPFFIFINLKLIIITFNIKIFNNIMKFSLPMIPSLVSAWVMGMFDRVFLERYFSLADVGIYSLSSRISSILTIISSSLFMAYNPTFYRIASLENVDEAKQTLRRYNHIIIQVLVLFSFAVVLFSKDVIILFFNIDYIRAYEIIPLLILGLLISQITGLVILSIYQHKKTKQIMYMIVSSSLLNLILNYMLIPKLGILGAALSSLITYTYQFIINYSYSRKCYYLSIRWRNILPMFFIFSIIIILFYMFDIMFIYSLIMKIIIFIITIIYFYKNRFQSYSSLIKYLRSNL